MLSKAAQLSKLEFKTTKMLSNYRCAELKSLIDGYNCILQTLNFQILNYIQLQNLNL